MVSSYEVIKDAAIFDRCGRHLEASGDMDKKYKRTKSYLRPNQRILTPLLSHVPTPALIRDIFVSHAAADKALVDLLSNLLRLGCGVTNGQIFYSSNADQGVPPGKEMSLSIKQALHDTKVGICIITPSSVESVFCISERGAIWVMEKKAIYLMIEAINYADVKAPIGEQKILRLLNARELDTMRDVLVDSLHLPRLPTGAWSKARDEFLALADPIVQKFDASRERGEAAIAANLPIELPQVINLLIRHRVQIFALVFDIDSMETINKVHGFAAGSLLLKEVSEILDNTRSRNDDVIKAHRCGDDTYFLIFKGSQSGAVALAEKTLKQIRHAPIHMRRNDIFVTASAGIAEMYWADTSMTSLKRAYFACAQARQKGGNLVEINKTVNEVGWS